MGITRRLLWTPFVWVGVCLAMQLALHSQDAPSGSARRNPPPAILLTVCELLEELPHYAGKTVAVVGRLSSLPFDGVWLSENGCNAKAPPSNSTLPYVVFLGCVDNEGSDLS